MTTKAEQETVIRWDREEQSVQLYTADPAQARRWTRLGYDVQVQGRDRKGRPRGWTAIGPGGCVRFRRVQGGQVVKRANGGQNLSVHARVLRRTPPASGEAAVRIAAARRHSPRHHGAVVRRLAEGEPSMGTNHIQEGGR